MRRHPVWMTYLYLIALIGLTAGGFPQQEAPEVRIHYPQTGQAVQGLVQVTGAIEVEDFLAYQLAFSFQEDPTGTWFLIRQDDEPPAGNVLGEWNTGALTDGSYTLRLIVQLPIGEPITVLVEGIRVRNYTPIETNTPVILPTRDPSLSTATPTPPPPTLEVGPTPTPLPPNPAEVAPEQVRRAVTGGGIAALAGLGMLSAYLALRSRDS